MTTQESIELFDLSNLDDPTAHFLQSVLWSRGWKYEEGSKTGPYPAWHTSSIHQDLKVGRLTQWLAAEQHLEMSAIPEGELHPMPFNEMEVIIMQSFLVGWRWEYIYTEGHQVTRYGEH